MNPAKPQELSYQSRIQRSTFNLACWSAAWVATCALMEFGTRLLWDKDLAITLLAVGLNFCVGIGLLLSHKKYLAGLDELQRKVYLDALAMTVGVVFIVVIPYATLTRYGFIHFKDGVSGLMFLMSGTFVASLIYGNRRYR